MRFYRIILPILALALVMPLADTAVVAAEPSAAPQVAPQAWLNGAFGRVLGADPAAPAGAAPDATPLNTWIRGAPLTLETDVAFEDLLQVAVVSRPVEGEGAEEQLSTGASAFAGPDTPGVSVVVATITTDPYGSIEHAWLVDVPDREGGEEALLDIPGPRALLLSGEGSVVGSPGHGCYAYLCVEVGRPPPTETLEPLSVGIGETLSLRLSDGSAIVGWTGTLILLDDARARNLKAEETFPDMPQAAPDLSGLEATVAGEWMLELRADYDRERGWQWFAYRLIAE